MSLAQALSLYLSLQLLLALGWGALRLSSWLLALQGVRSEAPRELKLHYRLLLVIALFTFVQPLSPKPGFFQPAVKIWSARSIRDFRDGRQATTNRHEEYVSLPAGLGGPLPAVLVSWHPLLAIFGAVFLSLLFLARDLLCLRRIRRGSFLLRRIGRVHLYSSDEVVIPFSCWMPSRAEVYLPSHLLTRTTDFQMAVAHELQHHRQRDTVWIHAMRALKILNAPNPAIHLWSRWLSRLQEFACDETLVDRGKVESLQYARCLIEVAQSALNRKGGPVRATGLTFLVEGKLLRKRIERMCLSNQSKVSRSAAGATGFIMIALMAVSAFASQGLVQDRRLTLEEARQLASSSGSGEGIPVVVNELVLQELNRYVGTPDGREFMRKALGRMETQRALVEAKIREYEVPAELLAIPLVESGYQNLEESGHAGWGAGLWMFIQSTARNYGLRVNDKVDERLNPELLTDAAMRYLKANHLLLKDWNLAILAYNMGENAVLKAIAATGTRDAWTLVRQGYENDQAYLARVMAAILIMRNPQAVQ